MGYAASRLIGIVHIGKDTNIEIHIRAEDRRNGAGIGATTLLLNNGCYAKWLLLEPDKEMSEILDKKISEKELPANCKLQTGTIDQLTEIFDTILYIDVLEHIESDKEEIKSGRLIK